MSAELPSTEQIFTETSRLVPLSKHDAKAAHRDQCMNAKYGSCRPVIPGITQ